MERIISKILSAISPGGVGSSIFSFALTVTLGSPFFFLKDSFLAFSVVE